MEVIGSNPIAPTNNSNRNVLVEGKNRKFAGLDCDKKACLRIARSDSTSRQLHFVQTQSHQVDVVPC